MPRDNANAALLQQIAESERRKGLRWALETELITGYAGPHGRSPFKTPVSRPLYDDSLRSTQPDDYRLEGMTGYDWYEKITRRLKDDPDWYFKMGDALREFETGKKPWPVYDHVKRPETYYNPAREEEYLSRINKRQ